MTISTDNPQKLVIAETMSPGEALRHLAEFYAQRRGTIIVSAEFNWYETIEIDRMDERQTLPPECKKVFLQCEQLSFTPTLRPRHDYS